ncbi:OstA-like protein [Pedobacter sp. AW1-32]|uniref:OstA-like protein n=1 Tax=Pedobacter sp. AW1-32 TaxID=3383026 RepID=UPI003FEF4059
MQKTIVFILFLFISLTTFAQQPASKIKIISYKHIEGKQADNAIYLNNPVFQQDNATLTCDSAVFYSKRNYFEAFRNVHINQLTTDIYSDQLEYDGNKKHAHLTKNVRMIDPKSVLTTNVLDYNTLSKIGTYTTGGKIVNQDVTLTSQNGYYFSNSSDAYFRYNVVVVTPQVTVKSDTLRYNMDTKWTYFYGPTNIKGKDDNMYTENGAYNTATEDAYFGKNNLYTQGTRTLKGDSLYYYGKPGYGKAVKNIVYADKKDGMKMFGQLGFYYKADQRALVTKSAYLAMMTKDSVTVNEKKRPDSLFLGADTLETQMVLQKTLKLIPRITVRADNEIEVGDDESDSGSDKLQAGEEGAPTKKPAKGQPGGKMPPNKPGTDKPEPKKKEDKTGDKNVSNKTLLADSTNVKTDSLTTLKTDSLIKTAVTKAVKDSLSISALTAKTDSLKNIETKLTKKQKRAIKKAAADSVKAAEKKAEALAKSDKKTTEALVQDKLPKVNSDSLTQLAQKVKTDSLKGKIIKLTGKDSLSSALKKLKPGQKKDTIINRMDTLQARAIKAYHGVKIFKSNIQAKADSLFYTSADSTMRCFINPIVWSEGSQQIGDTIYVQLKNNKLNNMQTFKNAFLVNTPADSLRFNQIKGRVMTGFFSDGKLKTLYVDGNSESIYFTQDDSTKVYKEMNQTLSGRIKFTFNDNDIEDIVYIKGVEGALNPEETVAKDNVLKGFSWKPAERPKSKKDAIGSTGKSKVKPKPKVQPKSAASKIIAKAATIKPSDVKAVVKEATAVKDALERNKLLPDTSKLNLKKVLPAADTSRIKKAVLN